MAKWLAEAKHLIATRYVVRSSALILFFPFCPDTSCNVDALVGAFVLYDDSIMPTSDIRDFDAVETKSEQKEQERRESLLVNTITGGLRKTT